MKSLSSADRAQSFIPLLPFIGKLMSLETAETGSLWMVITGGTRQRLESNMSWIQTQNLTSARLGSVIFICSVPWQLTEVVGDNQKALEGFLSLSN